MKKKILVMGLPGSGKSYLSKVLANILDAKWFNADKVRSEAEDWDFSTEGRHRQALRMRDLAQIEIKNDKHVIADFICPTQETRELFQADYIIYMNTIRSSRYADTNELFQPPEAPDFEVREKNADIIAIQIANEIEKYEWDSKKPTSQMLGRYQPWHEGHRRLFEEILKINGQVVIMVRDVKGVGDNPFNFNAIKDRIEKSLRPYVGRFQITLVPNITDVGYGRDVGYKFHKIKLDEETEKISATKIRATTGQENKI